jgi:hypothetical protein
MNETPRRQDTKEEFLSTDDADKHRLKSFFAARLSAAEGGNNRI